MVASLRLPSASLVVELGPGTGVFTESILGQLATGARLVVIELNPTLAAALTRRYAGRPVDVVHAPAAELGQYVDAPVDAVVSGLPWTVMAESDQRRTLDAATGALRDTGRFATFAYAHAAWTPPGRRFARMLAERFASVERGRIVWPNLPPAFVHRAAGPLDNGGERVVPPTTVHSGRMMAG
jgi:phospholipid N-methyltransferase